MVLLVCLGLCLSCSFGRLRRDLRTYAGFGEITGQVEVEGSLDLPIVLVAARLPDAGADLMALDELQVLRAPGAFTMRLSPGRYTIAAAEDANKNAKWDDGERIATSEAVEVVAAQKTELNLRIRSAELPQSESTMASVGQDQVAHGEVRVLSDARFGSDGAEQGIWEPARYATEHQPGIYMLQPFEQDKTAVLFVHGMGGYPQEFEPLIGKLDSDQFQPWVALYPSGQRLEEVARMLHLATNELEVRLGLTRVCVVGHSMGGLVARSLVGMHVAETPEHAIRGLVTIASPLGGVRAAATGVKLAPVVVPSWNDLDPASAFLAELHGAPLPKAVEYHLLFAYDGSSAGDGVAALSSQLNSEAQAEAEVVAGYWATHVGVLHSDGVADQVGAALRRCAGDTSRPAVAPRRPELQLQQTPTEAAQTPPKNAAFRASLSSE